MFQAAIADRIGVAEIFNQYDQRRMRLLTDEKIAWKLPFLVLRPFQFNRLHNKQLRLQIIATELSWWPQCFAFLMNSLFTHLFVNEHFMLDVSCDLLIIQISMRRFESGNKYWINFKSPGSFQNLHHLPFVCLNGEHVACVANSTYLFRIRCLF